VTKVSVGVRLRSFAAALLTVGAVGAVLAAGTAVGLVEGVRHAPVPSFLENTLVFGFGVMIPLWIICGLAGAAVGFLLVAGTLSLLGLSVPTMLRWRDGGGDAVDEGRFADLVRLTDRTRPDED
jgi:hypothetical protein